MQMYDLSSKLNKFYKIKVVLPQTEQNELYNKKDLNIERLKNGLIEYNNENKTNYCIKDVYVQGSLKMSTIVQNEDSDYDIDVAIIFDKDEIKDIGPRALRNVVAKALERKTKQFKAVPEVKTSCVRLNYADGYHIDFAVFRRSYDFENKNFTYEHASNNWENRDIIGLIEWFDFNNALWEDKLRKIVRLSKMFCKSRDNWKNMPSGLIQTILCEELLQKQYNRIDELFYYSMIELVKRLTTNISVLMPVDNQKNLITREKDVKKINNLKNRLNSKLEDLNVLFDKDCTENDALQAWYGFFNHSFWSELIEEKTLNAKTNTKTLASFDDTEEFIEDLFEVDLKYQCDVSCIVKGDGWRPTPLFKVLGALRNFLPHNFEILCEMQKTDCPPPYKIFWKVKNVGPEAERRNQVRGQIWERGKKIEETSNFFGKHYIECYIIKNNICVSRNRTNVPIGKK